MPDFEINSSCIKSIKASYKAKLESNKRVRGLNEYQEVERGTGGEVGMEPMIVAPKGQPTRKSRQAMAKRFCASASVKTCLKVLGSGTTV